MKNKIKKLIAGTMASTIISTLFGCSNYVNKSPVEISYFVNNESYETTTYFSNITTSENLIPQKEINLENKNYFSLSLIENALEEILNMAETDNINLTAMGYIIQKDKIILSFNYKVNSKETDNIMLNIINQKDRLNTAIHNYENQELKENMFFAEIAFCLVNEIESTKTDKQNEEREY